MNNLSRTSIERHISYLDRQLFRAFSEFRRVRLAKQAGAKARLDEFREEIGQIDAMKERCLGLISN